MATKGPWQSRSTEAPPSTCPPADRAALFERLKWSGTRSPACGVGRGRPPTAELSPASAVAQVALARLRPWGVVCQLCRQGLPPGGRAQQQPSAQCPRSSEGHICQARHHAGGADAGVTPPSPSRAAEARSSAPALALRPRPPRTVASTTSRAGGASRHAATCLVATALPAAAASCPRAGP